MGLPQNKQLVDATQQMSAPPGAGNLEIASRTKTEDDPALAGVRQRYLQMLGTGANYNEIASYLKGVGIKDPGVFKSVAQQVNFRNKNPKVPISQYSSEAIDDRTAPFSVPRAVANAAVQSGPGTAVVNSLDVLSMGALDNMAENPALARAALAGLRQQSPG